LHDKLGVVVLDDNSRGDAVYQATPGAVGDYTARIDNIGIERKATVTGRHAVPLWSIGKRSVAALVRHGAGHVLVMPDPSVLTHRGLLREDNAIFLYNVAALDAEEGRVYFDEYHHGIRSGGGYWSYLRYHGQHWVVLDIVLVAGMALWATGRRLGPATPIPVTKRTDSVDYASSVARIYEKADVRPLVAVIFCRHFQNALVLHLRLRRTARPLEILAAWRQRHGEASTRELDHLLGAAETLGNGQIPAAGQLLALAQRFDAFLDEHVRKRGSSTKPR